MTSSTDSEPVVLIVGTLDSDGVIAPLKALGRAYVVKRIDSSPENWQTICKRFEEERIDCVLVKLTGDTYHFLLDPAYTVVRDQLLERISQVRHAIFIYEAVLSGVPTPPSGDPRDDSFRSYFLTPTPEMRAEVNKLFDTHQLHVTPYGSNAELTILASAFLTDAENGLLFRVYLPVSRMWSSEADRLLTLFRDYLLNVGQLDVTLSQKRTKYGTIYEFFDSGKTLPQEPRMHLALSSQFSEFSRLLDLCVSDLKEAEQVLFRQKVAPHQIGSIVTRYAKEAKRIHVDLRHEREQKILSIRHRLEAELVDELPPEVGLEAIARLVESVVPVPAGFGPALLAPQTGLLTPPTNVTINLRPQLINATNSIVAQEILGDANLTADDKRLIELVQTHAPDRVGELSSAVREVADDSLPKATRILSAQRLKGFLFQLAGKIPDVALSLLQSYLEKRLGL